MYKAKQWKTDLGAIVIPSDDYYMKQTKETEDKNVPNKEGKR